MKKLQKNVMIRVMSVVVAGMLSLLAVLPAQAATIPAAAGDAAYYAPVFNAAFYAEKYADLKNVFGNDEAALLNHFITCGMAEGRQGSAEFNVQVYRDKYADLKAAFGDDLVSYYMHYIICGKAEGRTAATTAPSTSSANTNAGTGADPIRNGWDIGMAQQIFAYENAERASMNMKLLLWIPDMVVPAQIRARELVTDFTNKTTADGYRENIARGYATAEEVLDGTNSVSGWLATTSTRMNIFEEKHRYTAIGVYVDGNGVKYVVQLFDIPDDMK